MPITRNVQIHLTEPSRSNAAKAKYPKPKREAYEQYEDYQARVKENAKLRQEYTGPHFYGVDGCEVDEGVVHVQTGIAGYVYPLHTVARAKVYDIEVPDVPPAPPVFEGDKDDDIPF